MNKLVFLFQSLYLGHHSSLNISIFDSLWVNCDQRTLVSRLKNASFVRVKWDYSVRLVATAFARLHHVRLLDVTGLPEHKFIRVEMVYGKI